MNHGAHLGMPAIHVEVVERVCAEREVGIAVEQRAVEHGAVEQPPAVARTAPSSSAPLRTAPSSKVPSSANRPHVVDKATSPYSKADTHTELLSGSRSLTCCAMPTSQPWRLSIRLAAAMRQAGSSAREVRVGAASLIAPLPPVGPPRPCRPIDDRGPVELAVRLARHVVDDHHVTGHLVPGGPGPHVFAEVVDAGLGARPQGDDGADRLAEAWIGHRHARRVDHVGVGLQQLLDLLGVHLLAAGVDHRAPRPSRTTAPSLHLDVVARHAVAHAVDHRVRRSRLDRVLVVAERERTGEGDPPPPR